MSPKDNIIFVDFNGVLSYKPFWFTLKQTDPKSAGKIEDYLFVQNPKIVKDWMIGKYTSEQVIKKLCEATGLEYDYILNIFIEDCKNLDVSKSILRKLLKLKDTYHLILSTGNMDCFNRWTLPSNPLLNVVFSRIDNSYDLGYQKNHNEGRYFKDRITEYTLSSKQAYVIDDSAKVCTVFENLGGKAFCVTGEEKVMSALQGL